MAVGCNTFDELVEAEPCRRQQHQAQHQRDTILPLACCSQFPFFVQFETRQEGKRLQCREE
eukprot:766393-Hanusia_phi.AAC.19